MARKHNDAISNQVLPDPSEQLRAMAPAIVEILSGVRNVSQLGGAVTEEIYQRIRERSAASAKVRFETGRASIWPIVSVTRMHHEVTRPDLVQSVVLVDYEKRTRAVAIRLEGRNNRWLATAITVL